MSIKSKQASVTAILVLLTIGIVMWTGSASTTGNGWWNDIFDDETAYDAVGELDITIINVQSYPTVGGMDYLLQHNGLWHLGDQ